MSGTLARLRVGKGEGGSISGAPEGIAGLARLVANGLVVRLLREDSGGYGNGGAEKKSSNLHVKDIVENVSMIL